MIFTKLHEFYNIKNKDSWQRILLVFRLRDFSVFTLREIIFAEFIRNKNDLFHALYVYFSNKTNNRIEVAFCRSVI